MITRAEARKLRAHIETAVQSLGDDAAVEAKRLYPPWKVGTKYAQGFRVLRDGKLYSCISAHTSQADWTPEAAASLWTVLDETHAGTLEDPIPYSGNMVLENQKYYSQDGVVYLCVRDTVNPVDHALKDLLGLYLITA